MSNTGRPSLGGSGGATRPRDLVARPPAPPRAWRVLVVDDNPGDAELILERLRDAVLETLEVQRAHSIDAAARMLATVPVNVIILDLRLPDLEGIECVRALRAAAKDIPIVVVSGTMDAEIKRKVIDEGAIEAFNKNDDSIRWLARTIPHVLERHRAERERSELDIVLGATLDAILVVGLTGEVYYVNDAAVALFSRERADLLGERIDFSISEGAISEVTILQRGMHRVCEMRLANLDWQGERAVLATLRDITDQRALETHLALADRMVSIGTLASGIAHEINNPLAALIANMDLVTEDLATVRGVPSTTAEALVDISAAAERIRRIVRDVGLFSRSEDDVQNAIDVHQVIDSTTRMLSNEIRHRARLVKEYGRIPLIDASDSRLGQVLLNLLVNAAHSIPPGDCEANEVRISTSTDAEGRVVIAISDSGTGMSPEVQKRLFTPFFTTKERGAGTGLGLAICQRIIAGFGGTIGFTSELGRGTRFTITLPASQGGKTQEIRPLVPSAPTRRGRVLIVDDEDMIVRATTRVLSRDHDVVGVVQALDALALLRRGERFDLILSDVMMPQMTGIDLYAAVRDLGEGVEEQIVFMTGGAFTGSARAFLESIPNPLLEKPIDARSLRTLVSNLVSRSRG